MNLTGIVDVVNGLNKELQTIQQELQTTKRELQTNQQELQTTQQESQRTGQELAELKEKTIGLDILSKRFFSEYLTMPLIIPKN